MALNTVIQMGRLVADPELRKTGSGTSVASFRIAVDRDFLNKETNQRDADFFNVVAWRGTADFVSQYFAKGDMIVVDGRLQSRTYQDKEGANRNAIEIVAETCYFGGSKKSGNGEAATHTAASSDYAPITEEDSELPF